jgi:hypothetical protein
MTADLSHQVPSNPLESDLAVLLGTGPSAAIADRIDARVNEHVARWDPRSAGSARRRPGRKAGLIALLAAALALGGATGNLQALYLLVAGPFGVPWERGEAIGQSQVVDGYRVTVDRAYADATRLALAISVIDEQQRPGTTQLMAFSTVVTDEDGEYGGMGAVSHPDGAFAAVNVAWKVPAALPLPSGPRTFHVEIPFIMVRGDGTPPAGTGDEWTPWRNHAGPWSFDFELSVDGGTTIEPRAAVSVNGVTVEVTRVIAAPDIVRVEARVVGAPEDDNWAPVGSVSRDGKSAPFVLSSTEDDGSVALMTDGGLGEGGGTWTITFDAIQGGDARLAGPWVLQFDSP